MGLSSAAGIGRESKVEGNGGTKGASDELSLHE